MAMIEVKHLQKNFVKTVKEPGLKGALRSFIHPEKQTFEAVKDLTFEGYWSRFRTTHPAMVGLGPARNLHGFEGDLRCPRLALPQAHGFFE